VLPNVDPGTVSVGDSRSDVPVESAERKHFIKYAGASGDFNEIHYDEPHATDAGYPSVIGQGMFVAGLLSHFAANWLGVEHVRAFETRFENPLFPGARIELEGTVASVDRSDRETTVDVDLTASTGGDETLVIGSATAVYARDG